MYWSFFSLEDWHVVHLGKAIPLPVWVNWSGWVMVLKLYLVCRRYCWWLCSPLRLACVRRPPHGVAVGGLAFGFVCAQCLLSLLLGLASLFPTLPVRSHTVCYCWFLEISHFPLLRKHIITAWMAATGKYGNFKAVMWESKLWTEYTLVCLLNVYSQLSHGGYPQVGRESKKTSDHHEEPGYTQGSWLGTSCP